MLFSLMRKKFEDGPDCANDGQNEGCDHEGTHLQTCSLLSPADLVVLFLRALLDRASSGNQVLDCELGEPAQPEESKQQLHYLEPLGLVWFDIWQEFLGCHRNDWH